MPTKVDATIESAAEAQPATAVANAKEDVCCERFYPSLYDEKDIVWKDKPFVVEKVRCFLYVPINFGAATTRAIGKLESAEAKPTGDDFVMLSDMKSPWTSKLFVATTKEDVPNANIVHLSGRYMTKVFEGPYSNCGKWIKEMEVYLEKEEVKSKEFLLYYRTCPVCAKKYGKNYCVVFAKVD